MSEAVVRSSNQCYICAESFVTKDVTNGDVIQYDGRYVHVRHRGVPKSEKWLKAQEDKKKAAAESAE